MPQKLKSLEEKDHEITSLKISLQEKSVSCNSLLVDDKAVRFYTGLPTLRVFNLLYEYVEDKVGVMSWQCKHRC